MKKVVVKVEVEETHLLKKAKQAKAAIKIIKELVRDFELFNEGMSTGAKARQKNAESEERITTAFIVEIDDEKIKDQVTAVEIAMGPLEDAIEKLDKAIREEITKNIPQE